MTNQHTPGNIYKFFTTVILQKPDYMKEWATKVSSITPANFGSAL